MGTILVLILGFVVVGYLISAGILTGFNKLFKIPNPKFKDSLVILLVSGIAGLVAGIIFGIINLGILSNILVTVTTFIVFHYLLRKYYQTGWLKSLGIYILSSVTALVLFLIVIIPFRMSVMEPFVVAGDSMTPTYSSGDYLLIKKFGNDYSRGDVVVMRIPGKQDMIIKRIVGLPGEKVEIANGSFLINGSKRSESYIPSNLVPNTSVVLGSGEYYVLGDNPTKSLDSRLFGAAKVSDLLGKAIYKVDAFSKNQDK